MLLEDLKVAQKNLNLKNYLHLLYLVTPYDYMDQIKPAGGVYYDVVMYTVCLMNKVFEVEC